MIMQVYACKSKGKRENSTSGGMFSVLARWVLRRSGWVFGVALNERSDACHVAIKDEKDLPLIQGSKYIQSFLGDSYLSVKNKLDEGKWVLFSGTPCQIAGLRKFLSKSYEKLICVSIVCYGVISQKVWDRYKEEIQKTYGASLQSVNFRKRLPDWGHPGISLSLDDGRKIEKSSKESVFFQVYYSGLGLRKGCPQCHFREDENCSDFQLGDYWGIERFYPEFYDANGVSVVLVKTSKAERIFQDIKNEIDSIPTSYEEATYENPCICHNYERHPQWEAFGEDILYMSMSKAYQKNVSWIPWRKTKGLQFVVIGSHTARAAVRTLIQETEHILKEHISKSSIISMMSPEVKEHYTVRDDKNDNSFQKKCVEYDLHKYFRRQWMQEQFVVDYCVLDFLEERNELIICGDNTYITGSDAFADRVSGLEHLQRCRGLDLFEEWKESVDRLLNMLHEKIGWEKIIVLHNLLSQEYGNLYMRDRFHENIQILQINNELKRRYQYIRSDYPQIKMIYLNKKFIYTDTKHKYGCRPEHLNDRAHLDYAKQIWEHIEEVYHAD
ncbi:MAG: Coenzyme F420 hydrogenase/dehydrogenase, beta subunit C-terminal domain [Lachnospiraceae bacterium]|nr:Coenzyme F420 hydrogenase/dehydrogenase, beta subunit C-terminal domain [Lachnospiraceae bacterium]